MHAPETSAKWHPPNAECQRDSWPGQVRKNAVNMQMSQRARRIHTDSHTAQISIDWKCVKIIKHLDFSFYSADADDDDGDL